MSGTSPSGTPLCVLGVPVDKGLLLSPLLSSRDHQKITANKLDSDKDASWPVDGNKIHFIATFVHIRSIDSLSLLTFILVLFILLFSFSILCIAFVFYWI